MSSKKHSNAASQSSGGSSSKGRMKLTSYLWKKIGMLWKNYGKAMEFLFWGSVRTLYIYRDLDFKEKRVICFNLMYKKLAVNIRAKRCSDTQLQKLQCFLTTLLKQNCNKYNMFQTCVQTIYDIYMVMVFSREKMYQHL